LINAHYHLPESGSRPHRCELAPVVRQDSQHLLIISVVLGHCLLRLPHHIAYYNSKVAQV
jgi:hypothetical protein